MSSTEESRIKLFKKQLGTITTLDCKDVGISRAHQILGQDAGEQIHIILKNRIDKLGKTEEVVHQIRRARTVQSALNSRAINFHHIPVFKNAILDYQECLHFWAEGARLYEFQHPLLSEIVDGIPISMDDLATFLQDDEVGCQTGVLRGNNSEVTLWHTEEDVEESVGGRFDKLRLFIFKAFNDREVYSFIYPDLLPGAAFAWQANNYVQAIDSLNLPSRDYENGILPNTIAWLSLLIGNLLPKHTFIQQFSPIQGGYAMTIVNRFGSEIAVEKIEFFGNEVVSTELNFNPGSYLFQTNYAENLQVSLNADKTNPTKIIAMNKKRIERTNRFMRSIRSSENPLPRIFRMLRSRLGNIDAYSNSDVKAYLVFNMTNQETKIWIGAGPANISDNLLFIRL